MTVRTTTRFLAGLALLALLGTACSSTDADATGAGAPIVIGALTSFTGPFTPWGVQAHAGMVLAADEVNAAGGVDGRMVEIVDADDRNSTDEGVRAFERMVDRDGVLAVGGVISSSVGVAVAQVAEESETPLLVVKAGSPAVLTADSRFTFRTCLPAAPMTMGPLLQYAREAGIDRVGAIVADYAWGEGIADALEDTLAGSGIALQVEVAPVDADDFTPYLRSLQTFEAGIVVATGHPPGAGTITVQAADLGMDVPVTGPYAALATVVEAIGEVGYDRFADFACVDFGSAGYRELATRFVERTELSFMEQDAVAGYGIVQAVVAAVRAGADTPSAVAAHLHDNQFEVPGYSHPLAWTAWGELSSSQPTIVILRRQQPPAGVSPGADWYPEVVSTSAPLNPFEP